MPASKSNVVGIKPTLGLTSRYLVIPLADHQDTVGPLARTVLDAATVLSVIAGVDEYDNYTSAIPNGGKIPDYVAAATKYANLSGVRLGVPRNSWGDDLLYGDVNKSIIYSAFEEGLDVLRGLGAEIVDPANFTQAAFTQFDFALRSADMNNQSIVCAADFQSDLASYFSELTYNPNNLHTLADLNNYTKADPREDYPDRDTILWEAALALGYNESDPRAFAAWQASVDVDEEGGVTGLCKQLNLSAILIPTEYAPSWVSPVGLPGITVPLSAYPDDVPIQDGLRELIAVAPGIPFGLTFLGPKWSEETLIGIAAAFEKARNFRDMYTMGANATFPTLEIADIIAKTNSSSATNSTASPTASATSPAANTGLRSTPLPTLAVIVLLLWTMISL